MPEQRITIKFTEKGSQRLINAINKLDNATKNLTNDIKKTTKAGGVWGTGSKRLAKDNKLLANSFATARNKMLLFQFAMGLGIRQIIMFSKEAAKVQGMERAFNNLSGGASLASESMSKLQSATDGTMSKFDLFQQANNAMILGVTKNSDEMAKMFDMAQRLGSALGKDTKQSVESLITGLGRQSKLMLDNIGIMVDTNKAYEDFADANKTTVDALTDAERKQAFMNATLAAGEQKLKRLGKEILSADAQFNRIGASSKNLSVTMGEALLPAIEPVANAIVAMDKAINVDRIERFAAAITITAVSLGVAKIATIGLTSASIALYAQWLRLHLLMMKNPVGLVVGAMATAILVTLEYFDAFKGGEEIVDSYGQTQEELAKAIESSVEQLQEELDLLNAKSELEKRLIKLGHEASVAEIKLMLAITDKTKAIDSEDMAQKAIERTIKRRAKSQEELNKKNAQAQLDLREKLNLTSIDLSRHKAMQTEDDKTLAMMEAKINFHQKLNDLGITAADIDGKGSEAKRALHEMLVKIFDFQKTAIEENFDQQELDMKKEAHQEIMSMAQETMGMYQTNLDSRMNAEIAALRKTSEYKEADSERRQDMEAKARRKFQTEQSLIFRVNQAQALSDIHFKASQAILNATAMFPPLGIPWVGMIKIMAGVQAALVLAQKPPKFATGGLVGGRRHSQGGTMIEAEQGEFIMSRNAVESVGIENMNRINQSGGGAITVNVSGNVMTQDFVEGDLAEAIREATRRGVNFA